MSHPSVLLYDVVLDPLRVLDGLCGLVGDPLAVGKELVLVLPLRQGDDQTPAVARQSVVHRKRLPRVKRATETDLKRAKGSKVLLRQSIGSVE